MMKELDSYMQALTWWNLFVLADQQWCYHSVRQRERGYKGCSTHKTLFAILVSLVETPWKINPANISNTVPRR